MGAPAYAPHRCAYCASTTSRLTLDGDGDPMCADGEGCAAKPARRPSVAVVRPSAVEQVRAADVSDPTPTCAVPLCFAPVARVAQLCGEHLAQHMKHEADA